MSKVSPKILGTGIVDSAHSTNYVVLLSMTPAQPANIYNFEFYNLSLFPATNSYIISQVINSNSSDVNYNIQCQSVKISDNEIIVSVLCMNLDTGLYFLFVEPLDQSILGIQVPLNTFNIETEFVILGSYIFVTSPVGSIGLYIFQWTISNGVLTVAQVVSIPRTRIFIQNNDLIFSVDGITLSPSQIVVFLATGVTGYNMLVFNSPTDYSISSDAHFISIFALDYSLNYNEVPNFQGVKVLSA